MWTGHASARLSSRENKRNFLAVVINSGDKFTFYLLLLAQIFYYLLITIYKHLLICSGRVGEVHPTLMVEVSEPNTAKKLRLFLTQR